MTGIIAKAYGVASYLVSLAAFLDAIGFVGNRLVPKSIDAGTIGPPGTAALIDNLSLARFAVPHSVMASPDSRRPRTARKMSAVSRFCRF
jgi:hypothetical protein